MMMGLVALLLTGPIFFFAFEKWAKKR